MSNDRATWCCPVCDSSEVYREDGNTFQCRSCGQETLEKIGKNADDLETLAGSDLPVAEIAELLLSGDSA